MGKRVFRRGAALLAGLALVLSLAGCNKDGGSSLSDDLSRSVPDSGVDTSAPVSAGDADASDAAAPAGDASALEDASVSGPSDTSDISDAPVTAAGAPAVAVSVPAGLFNQYNEDRYTDERAPYLELLDDGTGVFRLNSGMGPVGDATGTWAAAGSSITFTVEDLEVTTRFRGDEAATLVFSILDADHLRFSGEAYGLTLNGDIFTREGAGEYDPNAAQSAASQPEDESASLPADDSTPAPDSAASTPADVSGADSVADESAPAEDSSAPLVIPAGDPPPSRVKVGDSFTLTGIDFETLTCEPALFDIFRGEDGQSGTLTATAAGEAVLSYALASEDGTAAPESHEITVAKAGGVSPLLLIIVGAVALAAGSAVTFVLLSSRRKKAAKGAAGGEAGEDGEEPEGGSHKNSKEGRELQAAKKAERKAAKEAKQAQQVADKTAKAAAKAASEAQKSAAKAAKAEEALAKAEAAYQLYREAEAAAAKAAKEAKEAVRAAGSKKGKGDADKKKNGAGKGDDKPEAPPAEAPPAAPEPAEAKPEPPAEPEAPPPAEPKPEKPAEPPPKFGANALTNPRKSTDLNNE